MARWVALLLAIAVLSGCDTLREMRDERYTRNRDLGRGWLSDQVLPAEINVSGNWNSKDWGKAFLVQNGSEVSGQLGDYRVEGVVSGRKAYLLISEDAWYYYSAILEMPAPDLLIGYYSRSVPYRASWRNEMLLRRSY